MLPFISTPSAEGAFSSSRCCLCGASSGIMPVMHVYIVAHSAYISVHGPCTPLLLYCSSGAKPGFKTIDKLLLAAADTNLAAPKSNSLALPSSEIIILSGLISLWIIPCLCILLSESMIGYRSLSVSSTESLPLRETRSFRVVPSRYSIIMYAVLFSSK